MSRLSIEVSEQEHQSIKALAALRGLTIKDYILERTLISEGAAGEAEALAQLKALLEPRIAAARKGELSGRSIPEIAGVARSRRKA